MKYTPIYIESLIRKTSKLAEDKANKISDLEIARPHKTNKNGVYIQDEKELSEHRKNVFMASLPLITFLNSLSIDDLGILLAAKHEGEKIFYSNIKHKCVPYNELYDKSLEERYSQKTIAVSKISECFPIFQFFNSYIKSNEK